MAKEVKIFNTFDIGKDISDDGSKSASLNTRDGFLVLTRDFKLKDPTGRLNPFVKDSLFDLNPWRRTLITESEDGQELFVGSIKNLKFEKNKQGQSVEIKAAESLLLLLEFEVEESEIHDRNPGTPYSFYKVKKETDVAENYIRVKKGLTPIPIPAYVMFDNKPSPRYQVIESINEAGVTVAIKIDRPLEIKLSKNARIRVSIPIINTIPKLIKRSLLTAGFRDSDFDESFDELTKKEFGYNAWVFVLLEHQIKFKKYLNNLLYMGNMFLLNKAGKIGIIKGFSYSGVEPVKGHITPAEIIPPINVYSDDKNLVSGYQCLYRENAVVEKATAYADQYFLEEYGALKTYKPIEAKTVSLNDYTILYDSENSANHYGSGFLEENKAPRYIFKCKSKRKYSGQNLKINYSLADRYVISANFNFNSYQQEPAAVYSFSQSKKFDPADVEFVLLNLPIPNLPRITSDVNAPKIKHIFGTVGGFTIIFSYVDDLEVIIEIFYYNGYTIIDKLHFVRPQIQKEVDGKCDYITSNTGLTHGFGYYLRMHTKKQYESLKTSIYYFEPSNKTVPVGQTGCK